TAANLLPQQALLIPLFRAYRSIPLPLWMSDSGQLLDSYWGLILVNVAFQTGFCTFVLSNYMKALPHEMYEAARVDGAGVPTQFFRITLPLCKPALAALATLQVTWIYNEFFWATVLMQSGDKFPITSSLNNLRGQFFTDYNLLSAGSILVAIPVLIVFFVLQKQFVAGLTLGSTKGGPAPGGSTCAPGGSRWPWPPATGPAGPCRWCCTGGRTWARTWTATPWPRRSSRRPPTRRWTGRWRGGCCPRRPTGG